MTSPYQKIAASAYQPPASAEDEALIRDWLADGEETHSLAITFRGKPYTIVYRRLLWADKLRLASEATTYVPTVNPNTGQQEAAAHFRLDTFRVLALKEMLIRFPVPISERTLRGMPDEVAAQVLPIVPDAQFESVQYDDVKKESAPSSEMTDREPPTT